MIETLSCTKQTSGEEVKRRLDQGEKRKTSSKQSLCRAPTDMDNGSVYIRIHDLSMGAFAETKMESDMEYLSDESWQWYEEDSENESKVSSDNYKSSVWYAAWFGEATDLRRNVAEDINNWEVDGTAYY
ncbi:unnamed protein product, partial [Porites evermanni]